MRSLLAVSLLIVVAFAGDSVSPPIVFTKPDLATKRDIDDLVGNNGIGSGTREARTEARRKLYVIGRWTVPPLRKLAVKTNIGTRVPMNAIMTLARIGDPECLPDLRGLAGSRKATPWIRQVACLSLGLFDDERDETIRVLVKNVTEAKGKKDPLYLRASALALARFDTRLSADTLLSLSRDKSALPQAPNFAAACILGAAIRSAKAEPERFIEDPRKIVRRAAAVGLILRPLAERDITVIHTVLNSKSFRDDEVRRLLWLAVAATPGRRADLLERVRRPSGDPKERVAAAIGLSYARNIKEDYTVLKSLLRSQNDPFQAALLHALLQTGDKEAVDVVLRIYRRSSKKLKFYAAGSLIYHVTLSNPDKLHPRAHEVLEKLSELAHSSDRLLAQLDTHGLRNSDLKQQAINFRKLFARVRDPYQLHLWDWTKDKRAWAEANRLLYRIFELDDIPDFANLDDPTRVGEGQFNPGSAGPNSGKRPLTGSPDEQDMLDFLAEERYFAEELLGGR